MLKTLHKIEDKITRFESKLLILIVLMPWANEWTMQLVFPIGFSMLTFHFGIRLLENFIAVQNKEFPSPSEITTASDEKQGQTKAEKEDEE